MDSVGVTDFRLTAVVPSAGTLCTQWVLLLSQFHKEKEKNG
jgi:hypothetical protein